MIPSKGVIDLSNEARRVYSAALRDSRNYRVPADQMDAAREIANAHLGSLYISPRGASLTTTRLAKEFTVADGGGKERRGLYAEVELLAHGADNPGVLLAGLLGAEFYRQDARGSMPWPTWRLAVKHRNATDVEHDTSTLADLLIDNPVLTRMDAGETTVVGIMGKALLYPLGTDIALLDDRTRMRLDEPHMCTECPYGRKDHPFAPYIPAERAEMQALAGTAVRITMRPLNSVDDHGLPNGTSTITEEKE